MPSIEILTPEELVRHVADVVASKRVPSTYSHFDVAPPPTRPSPFALIVGAGFSYGVVPLVRELMHETIGDYYIPDQDGSSLERPAPSRRKHSASFWSELNAAAARADKPVVELNSAGLPRDPGAAYQSLFSFDSARALFETPSNKRDASDRFAERSSRRISTRFYKTRCNS